MGTLMNLPLSVPVVAGWGFWLATGLVLLVWARRAREADLQEDGFGRVARPAADAGPKSGVQAARPASAPSDAFGELQAMLEPEPDLSAGAPARRLTSSRAAASTAAQRRAWGRRVSPGGD